MTNSNTTPHDLPTSTGQSLCRLQYETNESHRSPGNSGGSSDSERAWMYTPCATESRTVLKQVLMDEYNTGLIDAGVVAEGFDRYHLHEL